MIDWPEFTAGPSLAINSSARVSLAKTRSSIARVSTSPRIDWALHWATKLANGTGAGPAYSDLAIASSARERPSPVSAKRISAVMLASRWPSVSTSFSSCPSRNISSTTATESLMTWLISLARSSPSR